MISFSTLFPVGGSHRRNDADRRPGKTVALCSFYIACFEQRTANRARFDARARRTSLYGRQTLRLGSECAANERKDRKEYYYFYCSCLKRHFASALPVSFSLSSLSKCCFPTSAFEFPVLRRRSIHIARAASIAAHNVRIFMPSTQAVKGRRKNRPWKAFSVN